LGVRDAGTQLNGTAACRWWIVEMAVR